MGGKLFEVLNLKSSINFFKKVYGFALIFFLIPLLILNTLLLFNSHILSGFFPKIVYLPLIFPFSTDSKTKLFFSFKKLSIRFSIMNSFLSFSEKKIT